MPFKILKKLIYIIQYKNNHQKKQCLKAYTCIINNLKVMQHYVDFQKIHLIQQ